MFRIHSERTARYCDGHSRRSFLQLGLAGMGSLSLAQVLAAKEAARAAGGAGKDTALILLWLDGGPSHMDTYDMKPEAPSEYRGLWRPISTNVPGIEVTEMFPRHAQVADKFSLIRSMHHDTGDHFTGGHWLLTGRGAGVSGGNTAGKFPFFGSYCSKVLGPRDPGMPPFVSIPYAMSIGIRPGYFGANYLGVHHDPFQVGTDPNRDNFKVQNLNLPSQLTLERLNDRRSMLAELDRMRRTADTSGTVEAMDRFNQQAFDLVTGPRAQEAFDISREPDAIRDRYGRTPWGQSTLLARRLVEAGSTIVTCHFGGWDHHWNLQSGYDKYLPQIDDLLSALLTDLDDRGLLERVMVVLCGEFGRTPRMNDGGNGGAPGSMGTPGRDHWGQVFSILVAGGGIQGGRVVGSSNSKGEVPQDRPLRPGDLHHTIFDVLGVDRELAFDDHSGRPIPAIDHGDVIRELF